MSAKPLSKSILFPASVLAIATAALPLVFVFGTANTVSEKTLVPIKATGSSASLKQLAALADETVCGQGLVEFFKSARYNDSVKKGQSITIRPLGLVQQDILDPQKPREQPCYTLRFE